MTPIPDSVTFLQNELVENLRDLAKSTEETCMPMQVFLVLLAPENEEIR